ncbi:MAG: hypothetical protein NXI04_15775 [Planctomycetaceae bacterium]|nr:hypothetical protein [Planctomycetaceae bacterium]
MTQSFDLPGAAARQLADYDARQPGRMFGEGVQLDISDAYQLQAAVAKLRVQRGEHIIGYKVGCTSPTIRTQLGITHSVCGRLFDSEHHATGVTLACDRFDHLAIEGELAVELSRSPQQTDFADDNASRTIPACVGRVFPVIELHNHVLRGTTKTASELIANNAIHAGFCAGPGRHTEKPPAEADLALRISIDDRPVESCGGWPLIETINESLRWLHQQLQHRGEQLQAGQIILTGSLPPLIPITSAATVRVDSDCCGSVEARFTD